MAGQNKVELKKAENSPGKRQKGGKLFLLNNYVIFSFFRTTYCSYMYRNRNIWVTRANYIYLRTFPAAEFSAISAGKSRKELATV